MPELALEKWKPPTPPEGNGGDVTPGCIHRVAAMAAVLLLVLAAVWAGAGSAAGSVAPRLTNLSTSNRNLSYKTTAGALGALAPGRSVGSVRSFYSACSGTTVVSINSGPPVTVARCTWRTMSDGSSYVVKTVS